MKDVKKFQQNYQKKQAKQVLTPQAIRALLRLAELEMAWKGWSANQRS